MQKIVTAVHYRALRLRHDWWYRWAHDPLCDRLGGGVLKIGKLRLCRSCLAMYSGIAVGGAVAAAAPALGSLRLAPQAWVGSAAVAGTASVPSIYRRSSRRGKDMLRFTTGSLGGLLTLFGWARRWHWLGGLSAFAAAAYRLLTLARAKTKATACDGCPELHADGICSGYTQQAVSLRAYERDASAIATRAFARNQGYARPSS